METPACRCEDGKERKKTMVEDTGVSRRGFLKGAVTLGAAGIIGAAVTGCAGGSTASTPSSSISWDKETDVVILGTGGAGLCAAIAASRTGADVIVLEKAPEDEQGGNCRVSGNAWTGAKDHDKAMQYYKFCSGRTSDDDYLDALVTSSLTFNDTFLSTLPDMNIQAYAGFSPEDPSIIGGDGIQSWINGGAANAQLWNSLRSGADQCENIEWLYETPGVRLITDTKGTVIGVVAKSGSDETNIKAKKGVILACGGYEFNPEMIENSYPGWPVYSRGTPYNTGDGIIMAQKVGAGLWHMNASDSGGGAVICKGLNFGNGKYDSDAVAANCSLTSASAKSQGFILLNKHGQRFMAEDRPDKHGYGRREYYFWYDGVNFEFPNLPMWILFDDAQAKAGAICAGGSSSSLFTWFTAHSGYQWSSDNSAEVQKGWILKGDSVADLAKKMSVDAATLQTTIDTYNGYAAAGNDAALGRAANTMRTLSGPFYAVQAYPTQYNTQGGPKRNTKAQTLDSFGEVIPRLYNCGECGSGYGWVYNGGWNNCEAMVNGVWAGEDAAALDSWA